MRRGPLITPSAVVMRRSAFDLCGGFCEEFRRPGGEDPWMWLLARERGEFEYVPEQLVRYHASPLSVRADKYDAGRRIFVRLARQRYGKAIKPLLEVMSLDCAVGLAQKALLQMDSGDRMAALRTWVRVLCLKPAYFLDKQIISRLFRPRNLKRLVRMFVRAPSRVREKASSAILVHRR